MKKKRWNDADSSGDWKLVDGKIQPRRYNKNTLVPIFMMLLPTIALLLVIIYASMQEKPAPPADEGKSPAAVAGKP